MSFKPKGTTNTRITFKWESTRFLEPFSEPFFARVLPTFAFATKKEYSTVHSSHQDLSQVGPPSALLTEPSHSLETGPSYEGAFVEQLYQPVRITDHKLSVRWGKLPRKIAFCTLKLGKLTRA